MKEKQAKEKINSSEYKSKSKCKCTWRDKFNNKSSQNQNYVGTDATQQE